MNHYVIIAHIRVGYQYLASLLHSHPQILSLGEIFVDSKDVRSHSLFGAKIPVFEQDWNPILYIKDNIDPYAEQHQFKITGFKLSYEQDQFWDYIKEWKIIHLTRTNLLDRYISEKLAIKEEKWNIQDYSKTIHIPTDCFIEYCDISIFNENAVNEYFNPLKINYEELSNNTIETYSKILEYLEVEQCVLKSAVNKQRTKGQAHYISNYNQLYSDLIKSEYSKYLTDIPMI